MLLIVGGTHDAEARSAVARINGRPGPQRAALLDAVDMSRPGWRLYGDARGRGTVVAGGQVVPVGDIKGVLVRRLAVYPQELQHVHLEDRPYVASEMTALLAWWLQVLPVPVLNRAARGLLCGPGWRPEQWRARASRMGFQVARLQREAGEPPPTPPIAKEIVIVGEVVVGDAPRKLAECAFALARDAGASLLSAGFDESGALVTAHTMPRLSDALLLAVMKHVGLEVEPEIALPPAPRRLALTPVPAGGIG